jgi:alkylation response protein AidB-like acyl-CoA dehydrogenase
VDYQRRFCRHLHRVCQGCNDKNLSAFIVEKAFGGVTIGAEEKKLGIKGSSTVQVFFSMIALFH